MTRARAEELQAQEPPAAPTAPRPARATNDRRQAIEAMTTDVKLLLGLGALSLVLGLGWLVFGPRSAPPPAVLGYVDAGPPKPPSPPPKEPPFKLPWWK